MKLQVHVIFEPCCTFGHRLNTDAMASTRPQTMATSGVRFRLGRFSAAYRSRLLKGLKDLHDYSRATLGISVSHMLQDRTAADAFLAQYVLDRHQSSGGKSLSLVKHAILGCQHVYPELKRKLNVCWENLRVWEERRVTKLRPPLPVPVWVFMVGLARAHALRHGSKSESRAWLTFAPASGGRFLVHSPTRGIAAAAAF